MVAELLITWGVKSVLGQDFAKNIAKSYVGVGKCFATVCQAAAFCPKKCIVVKD